MEERLRRWNLMVVCCPDARKGDCCCEEDLSSCSSRRGEARHGQKRKNSHCVLNEVVVSGTQEKGGEVKRRNLQASDSI